VYSGILILQPPREIKNYWFENQVVQEIEGRERCIKECITGVCQGLTFCGSLKVVNEQETIAFISV